MSGKLVAALKTLPREHTHVLTGRDGKPLSWRQLTWIVQRVEKAAGLRGKGAIHILRHTYASHLAMANVPARTIQELARHTDLSTTMRYMHLVKDAKENAVRALAKLRR